MLDNRRELSLERGMTRPIRINVRDGIYHVMSRGDNRKVIFHDDRDGEHFEELLGEMRERFRVKILAYAAMINHYHLMIQTPEANCSAAIQWLNIAYGMWHNKRQWCCGHVFQGRFGSVLVENGAWALEMSVYIHMNPVAVKVLGLGKREKRAHNAGILPASSPEEVAKRLEALRKHRWSSYGALAGYRSKPEWLDVAWMEGRVQGGHEGYRNLVEGRVKEGQKERITDRTRWGLVLGSERYAEKIRKTIKLVREHKGRGIMSRRLSFEEITRRMEDIKGERWDSFKDRKGDAGRDVVMWVARRHGGYKLRELAEKAGGVDYTAISMALKRIEERMRSDRKLRRLVEQTSAISDK
jgi:putative transposase